jgi:hypothetical protein
MLHHPVLALFIRALAVEARSLRGYLLRLSWLAATLLVVWGAAENSFRTAPGLAVFGSITLLNLVLICLVGTQLFATAITEEKEEQTLGLLRMTGLSPVAILLGKSTGRVIAMALLLLAQLPFTMLCITLGGIAASQIMAAYAALLGLIVLMANLALLWSVICRTGNAAMSLTALSMLMLFAAPPMIKGVSTATRSGFIRSLNLDQWMEPLIQVSPFYRCNVVLNGFDGKILHVQLLANLATGLLFFVLAWWGFEFFSRAKPSSGESRGGVAVAKKNAGISRIFRPPRAWKLPLAWKGFFFDSHGVLGWMARTGIVLIVVAISVAEGDDIGFLLFWMGIFCIVAESGIAAGSLFRSEQISQTWVTIYPLPLELAGIVRQKAFGAIIAMLPWLLTAFVGMLLIKSERFYEGVSEVFLEGPVGLYLIVLYCAFLLLSTGLSLWTKRGGSLLAFFLLLGTNMVLGAILQGDDAVFGGGAFIYVIICMLGPFLIAKRLRDLASG